ncbi:FAD/NAD(P)-binding protein [Nocardioides maradonensis]
MRIVVIGAGPAGALTALHLVEQVPGPLSVTLVDPAERWARGAAFGTADERHLLNIPASRMSAYPDDPTHFVEWHRGTHGPTPPYSFLPRGRFGDYLASTLERAIAASGVDVEHLRALATGIDRDGQGAVVRIGDPRGLAADAVVVATGLPAAGVDWAPAALVASPRFVADPWAPGALEEVRRGDGDVLLVGTGLTMVDVALTLAPTGRRLRAISRSGRLPARHADRPVTPELPDITGWGRSLAVIREHAHAHVAAARRTYGDWRPGVDGLRHRISELWGRLDESDRAAFLVRDAARWNGVRHRIPPTSAATLALLQETGQLTIEAGEASAVGTDGWVVNCTGPRPDVRTLGNPLLDDLLRPRPDGALACVATAGMGVRTADGRLGDAPIWVLGALRRGELWESTAVPEIRAQAASIASAIGGLVQCLPIAAGDTTPSTVH